MHLRLDLDRCAAGVGEKTLAVRDFVERERRLGVIAA